MTTVNISQFDLETENGPNGIPIRNYFAEDIPKDLLKPFDLQSQMLDFFSSIFGPYPFEVYGSVVMDTDTGTALETQTLSIFGLLDLESPTYLEDTIAHELSHQWFGNSVSLADWSDIWLNESLATYSEGLWREHTQGREALNDWVVDNSQFLVEIFDELVTPGAPAADDLFNTSVYYWGALGLHAVVLPAHDAHRLDDGSHVIDAKVGGNAARWINHACNPNCEADEVDGRVFIKALRDLTPGEELFYDYGLVLDERHTAKLKKEFACWCGAATCRGTMLAPKTRSRSSAR